MILRARWAKTSFRGDATSCSAARMAAISFLLCGKAVFGTVMLTSPTSFTGTGLGAVPTILTIQDSSTEIGCVGFTGLGSTLNSGVCTGSSADVKTGASQTRLQPLSAAAGGAITSASSFAFIFNADQPAGGPITLADARVAFYSSTGAFLYQSAGLNCTASSTGCTFPVTASGMGKSGFEFQLSSDQQTAATAAGAFSSPSNLVGLSAFVTASAGGPETFYLLNGNAVSSQGSGISAVPEPSSIFLSTISLAIIGFSAVRRRSHSAK
jgi:hypothetical protein